MSPDNCLEFEKLLPYQHFSQKLIDGLEDEFAIEDTKSDLRLAGFIGGNHGCKTGSNGFIQK